MRLANAQARHIRNVILTRNSLPKCRVNAWYRCLNLEGKSCMDESWVGLARWQKDSAQRLFCSLVFH